MTHGLFDKQVSSCHKRHLYTGVTQCARKNGVNTAYMYVHMLVYSYEHKGALEVIGFTQRLRLDISITV